jgi:phage terminase large subunit-like protein
VEIVDMSAVTHAELNEIISAVIAPLEAAIAPLIASSADRERIMSRLAECEVQAAELHTLAGRTALVITQHLRDRIVAECSAITAAKQ